MRNAIILILVTWMISGCEQIYREETITVTDTVVEKDIMGPHVIADGATAQNSLDVPGKYKGVLPCADCEGIETEIELQTDASYTRESKYLGKKGGTFTASGKWDWIDGFTIRLGSIKEGPSQYFVAEGKLIQLDMSGNRISGALADKYVLTKQP